MNPAPESTPTPEEIAQANDIISQTPATRPMKRPSSIFVEASLPGVDVADSVTEIQALTDEINTSTTGTIAPSATSISSDIEVAAPSFDATDPTVEPIAPPLQTETAVVTPVAPEAPSTLPTVEFSPPPAAPVQSSLTLELRSSVGAEIRYVLGADDVGIDGTFYDPAQKIFLTQPTSIAARTVVNGQLGPLATARFEIVQPAWKQIEPLDQSDPTPHEIGEQCVLEGAWKLSAASTRGKLHAHRGFWREDSLSYGLANAADGTYAITIVSDGAGSANLSRVGSKLLCAVALEHLQQGLTKFGPLASDDKALISRDLPLLRSLLVEAASLALQKLREEAANRSRPLNDFSSTLLILVRREWNGAQLCAALQSGDGAIALLDDDGDLTLLGEADHGQHSSETKFLTTSGMEAELPNRVKFSIRPRLRAAMVMSDGIADDFFPETVRFPELFAQVMPLVEADFASSGAALLNWMCYEKKGSSDDRALVVSFRPVTPESATVTPVVTPEVPAAETAKSETPSSETTGSEVASSEMTESEVASAEVTGSEVAPSDTMEQVAPVSEEKPDGE